MSTKRGGPSKPSEALRSHGIRVALNDFGAGCASLSHLPERPFDAVRIDRSFVGAVTSRPASASIVQALVGPGKNLKLQATAEGSETVEAARALQAMGCDAGQGCLYNRPLPPEEVPTLIGCIGTRRSGVQTQGHSPRGVAP